MNKYPKIIIRLFFKKNETTNFLFSKLRGNLRMRVFAECMPCIVKQIETAIKLLAPETSENIIVRAQQKLMKQIGETDLDNTPNIILGTYAYTIIAEVLGIKDPYKELKDKYNKLALELYPQVKEMVDKSSDPLMTAAKASIMGNAIDFGAPSEINLIKELKKLEENGLGGKRNFKQFVESIKKAKNIIILGDNCGEIVFDKIFIEKLKETFPDKNLTYSVRGGPIINDSTMEDAKFVGMDKIIEIVEASATPGIYLERSSPEFIKKFKNADLILSKGQGNFEALLEIDTSWTETYYMLKAKCNLMVKIFDVPLGTLLLVKKDGNILSRMEQIFDST